MFCLALIMKKRKNKYEIYKSSSPVPMSGFQANLAHPRVKGIQVYSNEGSHFSKEI